MLLVIGMGPMLMTMKIINITAHWIRLRVDGFMVVFPLIVLKSKWTKRFCWTITPLTPLSGLNIVTRPIISDSASAAYDHLMTMRCTTDVQKINVLFHLCAEFVVLRCIIAFDSVRNI